MSASSSLNINTSYNNSLTSGTGGRLTDAFADNFTYTFNPGTGANQIDLPWSASATLTNAANTYTLSALVGPGAATTDLVKVRKFYIRNQATVDGNVLVATPGTTHGLVSIFGAGGVTIPAGGAICFVAPLAAGYAVSVGVTDQVTVTATGTVPYLIEIEGTSA